MAREQPDIRTLLARAAKQIDDLRLLIYTAPQPYSKTWTRLRALSNKAAELLAELQIQTAQDSLTREQPDIRILLARPAKQIDELRLLLYKAPQPYSKTWTRLRSLSNKAAELLAELQIQTDQDTDLDILEDGRL